MGSVPLTKVDAMELYNGFYLRPGALLLNDFYVRLDKNSKYSYKCRVFTRVIEERRREREEKVRKSCENM